MNVICYLGHPAHFHMLKHVIWTLESRGDAVAVMYREKEMLGSLVSTAGFQHRILAPLTHRGRLWTVAARTEWMLYHARRFRPDILIGTSAEITYVGTMLRKPSIVFNESDFAAVRGFAIAAYPLATTIAAPNVTDIGWWTRKKSGYEGYQKLAYLHPNQFTPDPSKAEHLTRQGPYAILRLVGLTAHHDVGATGLALPLAQRLMAALQPYATTYISAERSLPQELESYRLQIPPEDIHHAMAFAALLVGDSQSMAVEAALLGTPSIQFSSFARKFGTLNELEDRYGLTVAIPPTEPVRLVQTAVTHIQSSYDRTAARARMLSEKVDVTDFYLRLIDRVA